MQNEILNGFLEVDEILDNTRSQAQSGDVTGPLLPVSLVSSSFPCVICQISC